MKQPNGIIAHGAILLAACWLGGCASPIPVSVGDYYSTFDHERVVPSERVLRHGPYKLDVYPMTAELTGNSIFYAPNRNGDDWARASVSDHAFRESLEQASQEHFSNPKRPDVSDLMMGTAWYWTSTVQPGNAASNFGDFAFLSQHTNAAMRGMAKTYRCKVFGGKNANSPLAGHDFPAMRRRTQQTYPVLFPESGKGKRLNFAAIHVILWSSEDPDIPCVHGIWTLYQLGKKVPVPKFSYTTFGMKGGLPSACGDGSPLAWDSQTGTAVFKTTGGEVPLHAPLCPFTTMEEGVSKFYRELLERRFAASVIQLLNHMTDEELDALEAVEWGPDDATVNPEEYENDVFNYLGYDFSPWLETLKNKR